MIITDRHRSPLRASRIFQRRGSWLAAVAACILLGIALAGWLAVSYVGEASRWAREATYSGKLAGFVKALPDAPRHYLDGLLNSEEVPQLRLDVKFKHWQKILSKREEALQYGILLASKDDEVPAIITLDDRAYRAKIRLKGDFLDHLAGSRSWSLRVKSKGHLFGMRRFSLNRLNARAYAAGPLFLEYMRREGILAPRHRLVNVTVNGADWGLMALEEHVGAELLESQGRKDGVIGGFDDSLAYAHHVTNYPGERAGNGSRGPYFNYWTAGFRAYQEAKLKRDPRTARNLALAKALMAKYQEGSLPPAAVFDLDQFARYLAATTIWGYQDAQYWENTRLYLNPYTLKFEPIAGDIEVPLQPLRGIHMGPLLLVSGFMRDLAFREALERAIPEVTAHMLEGELFANLQRELERVEPTVHRSFPLLEDLDLSILRDNAALLARYGAAFFPKNEGHYPDRPSLDDVYAEHVSVRLYDRPTRQVVINNLLHQPITIERVVASCADSVPAPGDRPTPAAGTNDHDKAQAADQLVTVNGRLTPVTGAIANADDGIAVAPPLDPAPVMIEFDLATDSVIDATPLGERATRLELDLPPSVISGACKIEVTTRRVGTDEVRTAQASEPIADVPRHPLEATGSPGAIAAARSWLTWNPSEARFEGVPGAWSVHAPAVLPAGLRLEAGTTLSFAPGAYLIVKGPIDIAGTPARPVVLQAQDMARPWKGIYVMAAERPSRWQSVEIRGTTALQDGYLMLTGAVTFYRSDITMADVVFAGTTAEDALNIVHAQIALERTTVRNTRSDGFDCDFCKGTIRQSVFANIGGDALDLSGTQAVVETLDAEGVRDKVVSVGEGSDLVIRDLRARDVGTAIASKDHSRTVIEGAVMQGVRVAGLMGYVKKPAFGPAWLEATDVVFGEDVARPTLVQTGSVMVLNGRTVETTELDVETLYREGPMAK
jgi:hypothetical protein